MKKSLIYIFFLFLFFSACKIGHKYQGSQMKMPETFSGQKADTTSLANTSWWEIFNDTLLVHYIEEAVENNRELQIAVSRIEEFRAQSRIASSDLFPAIELEAEKSYQKNKGESRFNKNEIYAELSWELDLWGRLRWQRDAGVADYLAAKEDKSAVLQALISDVAVTYFELMASKRELKIIDQTKIAREEGVYLARLRYKGGLTSETPYRQAESELAKTLTLVPSVKFDITSTNNMLATLMGKFPEEGIVATSKTRYKVPDSIPNGLPSDLLVKRPDIRQAEQEVIAANAEVGMALTNMFPKISLTAETGANSSALSELFSSPYQFLSGQLFAPIFNAGANKARHKAARAVLKQKALAYDQVVLKGFEETNNALAAVKKAKDVREALEKLEEASRGYLKLAQLQHINGVVDYLDVLDAQRLLFDSELRLNDAIRDEKIAYILLYKALGGGW
ncbi:efflux transporter outer membrane subunit [Tamlana sp. 2201CG12-4]|uniref:efflux transporter outer membrane subunit n=1 Tax=Tamlana sp. 2201CG12-4 TaxID=3112582 RepID=UPI002DBA8F3E|nr:efflux transporter outer membrane subunit [Tamlana sp. 2201CG12-4]MEC3908197.1 efflux transporter outer membrane subunit [Tamlana sp. 2201CG12-4]